MYVCVSCTNSAVLLEKLILCGGAAVSLLRGTWLTVPVSGYRSPLAPLGADTLLVVALLPLGAVLSTLIQRGFNPLRPLSPIN